MLFAAIRELDRRLPPVTPAAPGTIPTDEFLARLDEYRTLLLRHRPDLAPELEKQADMLHQVPPGLREALVRAISLRDGDTLYSLATELGLMPEHLLFLGEMAVRPYLAAWARSRIGEPALAAHQGGECPVCGRAPHMGHIDADNIKWLHCPACETVWRYARVGCTHCGCLDSNQLGFFTLESDDEHRVDYCLACNGYLKVIDQRARRRQVDYLLEDAATLYLDELAEAEGYHKQPV